MLFCDFCNKSYIFKHNIYVCVYVSCWKLMAKNSIFRSISICCCYCYCIVKIYCKQSKRFANSIVSLCLHWLESFFLLLPFARIKFFAKKKEQANNFAVVEICIQWFRHSQIRVRKFYDPQPDNINNTNNKKYITLFVFCSLVSSLTDYSIYLF